VRDSFNLPSKYEKLTFLFFGPAQSPSEAGWNTTGTEMVALPVKRNAEFPTLGMLPHSGIESYKARMSDNELSIVAMQHEIKLVVHSRVGTMAK